MVGGIGDWLTSLFGGTPTYTPTQVAPNIPATLPGAPGYSPQSSLGGLLDPAGIRQQAAWSGLGALSAGLLAAGQRRAAGSPSPLLQAFGAFQPAYQGALQSGYQTAGAEQQFRQREAAERTRLEQEQQWQAALAAASPAERGLMQQMGREQWAQMQGNVEAARRRPGTPTLHIDPTTGQTIVFNPDAYRQGQQQPGQAPAGGQPATPGGTLPGQAPTTSALPSSGNPVIDATLNQIRPSESGNNPAAVSLGPDGRPVLDRNGQPLAGGLYQFTVPTWEGVRARHPDLNLTPDGRFDPAQAHRAAQAHAADILRELAPYVGRRGPNGEIIDEPMLIRGAWAGGVAGVRRHIESGGRYNPADVNGTSIGGYFTGQQLRGGGGTRGGAQPPAADPGIGEGGSTVSMTPGATPLPGGATAVPAGAGAALPEVAAGRGWFAQQAGPQVQPQAQQPQPQVRPTMAAPPQQPSIPGVTVLRPGQRPVGELVQVVGPNGQPMFVPRETAVGQTPYHAPPAASPLVEIMTPQGPRWVTREQAQGQPAVPRTGMTVTTAAGDTIQVGGTPGGTTAPTARALEEQIIGNTARLDRLRTIQTQFRPEFLQLPTQLENWTSAVTERLGRTLPPDQRQRLSEYTQFRSNAFRELNETIREMSGTAVSASEGERVLQAAPNVDRDSPTQFQDKLQVTIEAVRLANARLHYYRRIGIQPSFRGSDTGPIPLSNMRGVINSRGDEIASNLAREGVPRELISERVQRQLITEFGVE